MNMTSPIIDVVAESAPTSTSLSARVRHRLQRSRRHITSTSVVSTVLVAALVWLILPTGGAGDGVTVPVAHNLSVLTVSNGYHSRATALVGRLGMPDLSEHNIDRYLSAANAYGAATELVNGVTGKGLYLTVENGSPAAEAGLRSGDIVREIEYADGCSAPVTLAARWVQTYGCASVMTLSRAGHTIRVHVPEHGTTGSTNANVRTTATLGSPRQLNATSGLSAGLVLSLLFTDRLTDGSLFSADNVAGTGVLDYRTGGIAPILGLPAKAQAAYASGSTILMVPPGQSREIGTFPGMPVYEVTTTEQAVRLLCLRGADDKICERFPSSP